MHTPGPRLCTVFAHEPYSLPFLPLLRLPLFGAQLRFHLIGFFKPFQSQMILPPFGGKCSVNMYWMNEWILAGPHSFFFFKILFIYLFLERGKWREKERERNVNVWLPLAHPSLGTWPATQTWALTGNRICSPLVRSRHSAHWAAPARTRPQSSDHLVMAIVFNLLKI